MANRSIEVKSIMRRLREQDKTAAKNESVRRNFNEDSNSENDGSEADLVLARLEDILARFEKVIAAATGEEAEETEEQPVDEAPEDEASDEEMQSEDEDNNEDENNEDEDAAKESYHRSLEDRIASLERRYTESRRRQRCRSFKRY